MTPSPTQIEAALKWADRPSGHGWFSELHAKVLAAAVRSLQAEVAGLREALEFISGTFPQSQGGPKGMTKDWALSLMRKTAREAALQPKGAAGETGSPDDCATHGAVRIPEGDCNCPLGSRAASKERTDGQ